MKSSVSLVLALLACRQIAQGQAAFSGTMPSGITVSIQSQLEPAKPAMHGGFTEGVKVNPTFSRFAINNSTHEYFGYSLQVDLLDQQKDTYRVSFGPLREKPEDLDLTDPSSWHSLPPPALPAPEVINGNDTIAFDLFINVATGQRIVDYIHIVRRNCEASPTGDRLQCVNSILDEENRSLAAKLKLLENRVPDLGSSQQAWEAYRDSACSIVKDPLKQVHCKSELAKSRRQDLDAIY